MAYTTRADDLPGVGLLGDLVPAGLSLERPAYSVCLHGADHRRVVLAGADYRRVVLAGADHRRVVLQGRDRGEEC